MSRIPTYSLLEKHEEIISYRIPDPTEETSSWIKLGLFSWNLEEKLDDVKEEFDDSRHNEDTIKSLVESEEGIGMTIEFNRPSRHYPYPTGYDDYLADKIDIFSKGGLGDRKFRVQNATASDLREFGKWISLYAFCYWDWVDSKTTYPIGKQGTMEEMKSPVPNSIFPDGTVTYNTDSVHSTPYCMDNIEIYSPADWESPNEIVNDKIKSAIDNLDKIPQYVIDEELSNIRENIFDVKTRTKAKRNRENLKDALVSIDSIGKEQSRKISNKFNSISELCGDIHNGGDKLRSIRGIGDLTSSPP